ncbi:hypothetical protein LTR02_016477 [Friedmanniomyces endolithicus]|nr:hypothetical protein LTR02_016477 [Friedmanniomyces endolithicus]
MFSSLLKMKGLLSAWERGLSPDMSLQTSHRFPMEPIENPFLEKLRVVLTLRYHNLRILIHRAVLVRWLDAVSQSTVDTAELSMLHDMGARSLDLCVESSTEIISLVRAAVAMRSTNRNLLGAWWFSLYYVFNAALTLFATFIVSRDGKLTTPQRTDSIGESKAVFYSSVETLRSLDPGNRAVDKCRGCLEQLLWMFNSPVLSKDQQDPLTLNMSQVATEIQPYQHDELMSMLAGPSNDFTSMVDFDANMDGGLDFLNYFPLPLH